MKRSNERHDSQQTTAMEKVEQPQTVNVPDQIQRPAAHYTPLVDVAETAEAFVFHADLPGVKPGDVDLSYDNGTLTIEAKVQPRQPAGHDYAWREYGVGHFYRSFVIDTPVEPEGIKAELRNGVLELYVPKAESARPKKIEVKSA